MSTMILNPLRISAGIWRNRYLLGQLVKRDVLLRYRGAYIGMCWIFLNPLIMLGIFSFVFGEIFQTRWPIQSGGIPFALNLYCGLIAFNIFAETISRAPATVRGYPSYVKKIIFPVEILPIVPMGSALIHAVFNIVILEGALAWSGHLNFSGLLFPLLLLPLIFAGLGLAWFLGAWGVFLKDMSQVVPVFVQILMFLSPVFYPALAVPEAIRPFFLHNPLGSVIEAMRAAIAGNEIDWSSWVGSLVISILVCVLGYSFFHHSRDEFADVL